MPEEGLEPVVMWLVLLACSVMFLTLFVWMPGFVARIGWLWWCVHMRPQVGADKITWAAECVHVLHHEALTFVIFCLFRALSCLSVQLSEYWFAWFAGCTPSSSQHTSQVSIRPLVQRSSAKKQTGITSVPRCTRGSRLRPVPIVLACARRALGGQSSLCLSWKEGPISLCL